MKIHFHERDVLLRNVQTRVERHGDDEKPAIDLAIGVTGSNEMLDMIHPELLVMLFTSRAMQQGSDQAALDMSVSGLPNVRVPAIDGPIKIGREQIGMSLHVAYGATGKQDMVLGDVRMHKVRIGQLIEGGTVELLFTLSTTDVNEKVIGKLSLLQGHEITITLTPPEVEETAPIVDSFLDEERMADAQSQPTAEDIFTASTTE